MGSQSLSLAVPIIVQWAHEQVGRDVGYVWAQQHGLPITKADLTTAAAECQMYRRQRPARNLVIDYVTHWFHTILSSY